METPVYRLDLCYQGTHYQGWQSQPSETGVQDRLEHALATFLRHPVRVTASSRTDAGVHAEQQVVTFKTHVPIDPVRLSRALNSLLPKDIGVLNVQVAKPDFHPILSSLGKAYRYRLWQSEAKNPFVAPFVWKLHPRIDIATIKRLAQEFVGTHDFTSFCATDSSAKTRERTIFEMRVEERGPLVDIWIIGNGFLKQMVRAIVGTLIEFADGKHQGTSIGAMLAARDRKAGGSTAPAQGLSLVHVFYERVMSCEELIRESSQGFTVGV